MRSLAAKLTLAFLIVSLASAVLIVVLVQWRTRTAFEGFIQNQEQDVLVSSLEQHYAESGSWQGVVETLRRVPPDQLPPRADPAGRREVWRAEQLFTLVGPEGRVIFGARAEEADRVYSIRELEKATPLEVEGKTVGWLVRETAPNAWLRDTPEGAFLRQVNRAGLISALTGAGLALLLGSLIAYTLTRSLRELKTATEEIAQGRLGAQVTIRTQDELGELASSFNRMSSDLARATVARRQMTADIAHDLRTPLSVIAGYTEALSDGKLPGSTEVYGVLHQETLYLRRLIDDLRTLSLADSGELPLFRQPLSPQTMLEQAALRHAVTAKEKEIALRAEVRPDLPMVDGDPQRLSQVFDNLILNALRHTPEGGEILLSARQERNSQGAEGVLFRVQDTGSGISAEDLPNIFNRFYRGDPARQQNGESGLGLAIARSIVEAHGGTIRVESTEGQGAVFFIWLPRGEQKE